MMSKIGTITKQTFLHWYQKNAQRMGAAISYYTLFSIAPLFILMITLVRLIFSKSVVDSTIFHTLQATVGTSLAHSIETLINAGYYTSTGLITTIVSGAVLIIVAISVLSELNNDLDELWHVPSPTDNDVSTPAKTIMTFIKDRLVSLSLIFLFGLLLLLSVAFTVFFSFFHFTLPSLLENSLLIQSIVSLIVDTILFTLVYRILPDTKLPWREIVCGAFATALLFLSGKFLISWYIAGFGSTSAFGTASSIVGLLLWVYYSAQVFFIGASGTFVYSKQYGFLSKKN